MISFNQRIWLINIYTTTNEYLNLIFTDCFVSFFSKITLLKRINKIGVLFFAFVV